MHLRPGLTPEAASLICQRQCQAQCCRGPQYLRLDADEVEAFERHAAELGVEVRIRPEPRGGGSVRYLEHEGDRCPMLDPRTWRCRIYEARPNRCRAFPESARPGCAISTLDAGD